MRIFLLLCSVLACFQALARSTSAGFVQQEVKLRPEDIFITNTISIQNTGTANCVYSFTATGNIRLFNAAPLVIAPGETRTLPLKFMLPKDTRYDKAGIIVSVTSSCGDTVLASFVLQAPAYRDVYMSATSQEPADNRSRLAVFIRNRGNTTEKLKLYSSDVSLKREQMGILFSLAPYADTTIYLLTEKRTRLYNSDATEIFLLDDTAAVVTSATIQHQGQGNVLRLQGPQAFAADNFASVQMNSIGNNYSFREYQLSYNRNGQYNGPIIAGYAFERGGGNPLSISNTYVGYRYGAAMLRAGAMNIFGELPIYGQGAEVSLGDQQRYIRAAYLFNNNTYLTWDGPRSENNTKNIKADIGYPVSDQLSANISFLREWNNPFYKDIYLSGTTWNWHPSAEQNLEASLYGSTGITGAGHSNGLAGHVKELYRKGHWSIFSDNYYSTPQYAGLLNNTQQFIENGTYYFSEQKKNAGISLRANYLNMDNSFYGYAANKQMNNQYGVALFKTIKATTISFYPFYTTQQSQFGNSSLYSLNGWFASADVQYLHKTILLAANLITPLHKDQTNELSDHVLPLRAQLQAQYKFFFLQASYQSQAFYATDLLQESATGKAYRIWNISPGLNFLCLRDMLRISANYNLQYMNNAADPYHYSYVSLLFQPLPQWQFTATGTYTWNGLYHYKDLRVGIRFLFHRPADVTGRRRTVVFFNDANHNGRRDAGENTVKGITLAKDAQTAVSDERGKINVIHYKASRDELTLMSGNGYSLLNDLSSCRLKKKVTYIPLYKLGIVNGRLQLEQSKFRKQETTANGLPLVFTNETGKEFTCLVQQNGTFSISLPTGIYTIKVQNDLSDMYHLQQPEPVSVKAEENVNLKLNATYKYAQPVDVIHFSGKK
ncbi:COG1470 family protein [Chitinophagaceae bacterium MMS25-I14]